MSSLTAADKQYLERVLGMAGGYVLEEGPEFHRRNVCTVLR